MKNVTGSTTSGLWHNQWSTPGSGNRVIFFRKAKIVAPLANTFYWKV